MLIVICRTVPTARRELVETVEKRITWRRSVNSKDHPQSMTIITNLVVRIAPSSEKWSATTVTKRVTCGK